MEKLNEIKKNVAISESVKKDIDQNVALSRNNVEKLNESAEILNKKISDREAVLRELENDINLFPTEISGYVNQGAKNINLYAALCCVPLIVIIVVTARLFINSQQLLSYVYNEKFTIFEFLISRTPYVVVSAIILAVSYTVLQRLITEIIGINRRRQDLFKISIIATDVSNASQNGLELSDEESYDLRTQTKMELLKEHLRQHIGEDYVYKPRNGFVDKMSTVLAKNIGEAEKED